ncbi:60S acidic ribosomal protein P1-alpha 1 [Wickerhamiella sorbophila]|uniref:60S acidic ribosomal protein P1-alpha 1 n=1 Tax=Wickerhamiella sorbophila TaxID=45607 RepID=A0A2T0FKK6_9ASCO|nr:60S acidic ribosomal protein P1-alpha 1 [Wickerhamiella sorbophila]PRT55518.1 60S acidic ribosomal protein P1-alpha 1 [Wickerhamiella sorbophila]
MSNTEAAISYATLILADADIEITADKLLALAKSANVSIEPIWAEVFAKATEGQDLKELLFSFGAAGPAAAAGSAPAAAGGDAAAPAEQAASEEEESDGDMGMGLFD